MTSSDIARPRRANARRAGAHRRCSRAGCRSCRRNRIGAVAAKDLRYYLRDPRRRGPLIAAMIVPGLFLFETLRDAPSRPPASTLLALVALLPASGLTLNQFGLDGAALWSTVVAGNDPRADLTGKNIATAVIVVPARRGARVDHRVVHARLGVPAAHARPRAGHPRRAARRRRRRVGVGAVRDARPAQPARVQSRAGLRRRASPRSSALRRRRAGARAGRDRDRDRAARRCRSPAATVLSVVVAGVYGAAAWLHRHRASRRAALWWRMPELLDAVSPRHAG